jgi:hypothetical protein
MQQRGWITMTAREHRRAQVLAGRGWRARGAMGSRGRAGLSVCQARRLKRSLVRDGPAALAHASRGRASPRRLTPTLRHVSELYLGTYRGLNHQHFCELLAEREQVKL